MRQTRLAAKQPDMPRGAAGSLKVAGTTAYASVRTVDIGPSDVVVVSGAAGVGSLTVHLAYPREPR